MDPRTLDWPACKALAERHKIAARDVVSDTGGKAGRRTPRDAVRQLFAAHAAVHGPQPKRHVVADLIGGALLIVLFPVMLVAGAVAWGIVR